MKSAAPSVVLDDHRYAGWDGSAIAPARIVESPYEHRVKLVSDVLTRNSVTTVAEATRLAIQVLHAIDHIPEQVR